MKISRRATLFGGLAGTIGLGLLVDAARAGSTTYEYDPLGRLKKVTYPDGASSTYTTNYVGNRTQRAQAAAGAFVTTIQITGSGPINLRTLANSLGYSGLDASIIFEVGNGVTIMGDPGAPGQPGDGGWPGGTAIVTGTWPGGQSIALALKVKSGGEVIGGGGGGGGGAGGAGYWGGGGGSGGTAVSCSIPMTIEVESGGAIRGGGAGGAGGYNGYEVLADSSTFDYAWAGGGGGGGGYPNGAGGIGATSGPASYHMPVDPGLDGSPGTTGGGGAGGTGGYVSTAYGSGSGDSGSSGSSSSGGYAIAKNGNTVTVTNNGTISGSVV